MKALELWRITVRREAGVGLPVQEKFFVNIRRDVASPATGLPDFTSFLREQFGDKVSLVKVIAAKKMNRDVWLLEG